MRGSPTRVLPPPGRATPWSPIPASRSTARHAGRPPPPTFDGRSEARDGTLPSREPSKSPANAPLASVWRPLSQDCHKFRPLIDPSAASGAASRPRFWRRSSRLPRQAAETASASRPDTQARATRRFSRDPAPGRREAFLARGANCCFFQQPETSIINRDRIMPLRTCGNRLQPKRRARVCAVCKLQRKLQPRDSRPPRAGVN